MKPLHEVSDIALEVRECKRCQRLYQADSGRSKFEHDRGQISFKKIFNQYHIKTTFIQE